MADFEREDLIEYLIGNEEGINSEGVEVPFTDEDRETLESFTDNQLLSLSQTYTLVGNEDEDEEELEPVDNGYGKKKMNMKKKKKAKAAVDMEEGEEEGTNNQQMTLDDWMRVAPAEVQNVVRSAIITENQRREQLVEKIKTIPNNVFTENQLKGMDLDTLAGIASLAPVQSQDLYTRFAGAQGSVPTKNQKKFEPLKLPTANSLFGESKDEE